MDFIEQLPASSDYSAILVIVDRLTKQALFLPTMDNVTSEEVAQLYFKNVFSRHGVPAHITSDCGAEFVSHFFRSLGTLLGICLHFTSGYHPQADGQTERVNQMLEQYLCIHCNYQQDDWSNWLPVAEFAYNNAESSASGTTPFFTNKGYHLKLPTYPPFHLPCCSRIRHQPRRRPCTAPRKPCRHAAMHSTIRGCCVDSRPHLEHR
jgi:hypothetical protein